MYKNIEADINEEVESSVLNSFICISSKVIQAVDIKKKLIDEGLKEASVLKINYFTFFVNKRDGEAWNQQDIKILNNCFDKIHKCK